MAADVLGVSGSPIPNSNTDRAVRMILESTGLSTEFVKLSDLSIEPCRACLGCVETNQCVVEDDGPALADKLDQAQAIVLGGYTPYSSLDARTKCFMERMYCHRHQQVMHAGKIGATVITTACPPDVEGLPPAAETANSQIDIWMMTEGIQSVGSLVILGNVPCIRCGHGDECEASGIKMLSGPEATVESVGVRTVEGDASLVEAAKGLGQSIGEAVRAASGG